MTSEVRAFCPFCESLTSSGRKDPKFYVNLESGLYYCFHCQEKGKDLSDEFLEGLEIIQTIEKKTFDQTALARLETEARALQDFRDLRLNGSLAELFYEPQMEAIAIPVRNFQGDLVGLKYRRCAPDAQPRYLSEPGSLNEGFWLKGEDPQRLLIVEGEIDALTAALAGFKGSILATQTNRLAESQLNAVKSFKDIFLTPDNDLGGTELQNSIERLLGPFKVTLVKLPDLFKDLNEFWIRAGSEAVKDWLGREAQTELERQTRELQLGLAEAKRFLRDMKNRTGDSTGWKAVDELLGGGLRASEMTVINSFAKTGKSSFVHNLVHNLAFQGKKVAVASFELPPHAIFTTLISIALERNMREMPDSERDALDSLRDGFDYLQNVVMLERFGFTPWQEIEDWAHLMKRKHGIDYLVLDHAGFLTEKMTDAEENQILAKNIKKLTNTLQVHIPIVVQAPKTKDGLSLQTSYGGMAWAQNADNFFTLERSKENETELKVRLEAARYPAANPSSTPALLFYQRESCSLVE